MRTGVRLGIDVGKARIGISRCDPSGMLATPIETVPRDATATADVSRIVELIAEYDAIELVVGLPIGMSGHRTPSTEDAEHFALRLANALQDDEREVTVRLIDERLSTVSAQGQLRQAGKNTKSSRSIIDQAAAVVILQQALDMEKSRGVAPGTVVEPTLASADPRDKEEVTEIDRE